VDTRSKPSFYKPELDILRFFAFLVVFVFHAFPFRLDDLLEHKVPVYAAKAMAGITHGGAYGVDIFFVLSAYLITELLLREKDAMGSPHVWAFYIRRILRIWPLYYAFVALAVIVPFLSPQFAFSPRYLIPFLFFVGNWSLVAYGVPASLAVPLWSVSIEEQFYLFWPPVVARLSRRQLTFAAILMILLANLCRLLAVAMHQNTLQLWVNTFAHLDSIGAGILVAIVLRGDTPLFKPGKRILLLSFGLLCLALRGTFVEMRANESLTLVGTLIGYPAVVLACTAILLAFLGLPLRSGILEYLGKISYGLYVYHVMCLIIAGTLLPGGHGPIRYAGRIILAFAMTIAISAVSYAVLEKPFLRLKRRFTYVESRSE
jgi:peptidoglycan/LPS O-acetylase OafA/YrhL